MKKCAIILALASIYTASNVYAAEVSTSFSGFIDNVYTISNENADDTGVDVDGGDANAAEQKLGVAGELDFIAAVGSIAARIDLDAGDSTDPTGSDVVAEQAFASWQVNDDLSLLFGRFNNPMGFEAEDAPDMYQTSHSLVWGILDGQTALVGNNIQGMGIKGNVGSISLTGALLNDINGVVDENNSFLGVIGGTPIEGLDLELSFITQEDNTATNPNSLEGITDFNAAYGLNTNGMPVKVWLDWLIAGEGVDSAYSIGGMIGLTGVASDVSLTLRFDNISYDTDGVDDQEATTLAATWTPISNLALLLEWRNDDNGIDDGDALSAEGVFTF